MMRDGDGQKLIANITESFPIEIAARFDAQGTLRLNGNRMMLSSIKIKFTMGTEDIMFWEIEQFIEDCLTPVEHRTEIQKARKRCTPDVLFKDLTQKPSSVRVRLEAPPWKKDHISACGKFYGTWRQHVDGRAAMDIRTDTGSGNGVSTVWTKPTDVTKRPVELAKFKVQSGLWEVHQETWDKVVMAAGVTTTYANFVQHLR